MPPALGSAQRGLQLPLTQEVPWGPLTATCHEQCLQGSWGASTRQCLERVPRDLTEPRRECCWLTAELANLALVLAEMPPKQNKNDRTLSTLGSRLWP